MSNEESLVEELIPIEEQESEEDIEGKVSFNAVSMTTDWTIETINGQVEKENIDLMPEFQRRRAWDDTRKSRLIESIIVGLPVPNIVLAEDNKRRGKFIVIDGKQRLVSINEFYKDEFKLEGLDLRQDLNNLRYSELPQDDRSFLDNSTLRSTLIKGWKDEKFLYIMFYRLNSGSLPLSPQELRKALIGGRLIDRVEGYLESSESFHSIFGAILDKRMRDSELVLRYVAFDKFYPEYGGNLKEFLDHTARYFEDANHLGELDAALRKFDLALSTAHSIFGENAFKKWLGNSYERRINRAIFDCITRYFSEREISQRSLRNPDAIVRAFNDVCMYPEFKESIERTTKSIASTELRLQVWGRALAQALGMNFNQATFRID